MKIWKQAVLFYLGGMAYTGLELLWRGWSHGSMFVLGGLCFLALGALNRVQLPIWGRMLLGAAVVTALELLCGLTVNRSFAVWDYRHQPGNFLGQICPVFSLLWVPVSLAGLELHRLLNGWLSSRGSAQITMHFSVQDF